MNRRTWKLHEQKCAEFFGGKRTPLSGSNSLLTSGDITHPVIYAECKSRKKLPFERLWKDTEAKAKAELKVPIVVLFKTGSHPLLLCNLHDVCKIAAQVTVSPTIKDSQPKQVNLQT